ncbi:ATP-binding protein [Kroppenstedtia eburnea]|uniref:ATP-binding protein n=1 Tax=Kroppenstedtia eburnea TaxID=714067 RepID=UPI0036445264
MPIAFHLDLHPDQLTSWVKNCTQAVVTVDDQGVVKMVSPQFLKLLQCPLDQVVEQPLDRHLHLPPEEMERLRHPDAHGGLRWVQGELLPFGSSPKTVTLQLISGKSSDGWLHLLLIYSRDQGAHHLQRHAEQIVNSLPQGIVLLDSTLRVTEINPAACRIFGVNRDDLCGQEMKRLFLRLEGGEGVDELEDRIRRREPFRDIPASWILEGVPQVVTVDYEIAFESGGESFLTINDITRNHLLDLKVRQTDRLAMIGQMAAGTAHEIRNPLTSIRGFLQVIRHTLDERGDLKGQGYAEIMLREIDRINHLLGEFLLMGKPRNVKKRRVELDHSLRELLPIIENEAILHNIEVRYLPGLKDIPPVWADPELLKQVVLNLCKNGIEAMGEGGLLQLRLSGDEERLILEVEDHGPGIPDSEINLIFDPFYTTKENGTGLGLAVSKQIIEDIGGEIQVSSGEAGSIFSVILPCVRD